MWAAQLMGVVMKRLAKGLEYARFSIDSHFTRNYLCGHHPEKLDAHVPEFAKQLSLSTTRS